MHRKMAIFCLPDIKKALFRTEKVPNTTNVVCQMPQMCDFVPHVFALTLHPETINQQKNSIEII